MSSTRKEGNMVKVEVIENFTLGKFDELKNLKRANPSKDLKNYLYVGDVFECTDDMATYLEKTNAKGKAFIKVLEVIPEKIKAEKKEPAKKTTTNKKTATKKVAKKK